MKYLHNSSFDKTKAELEEKGCSYSNAVLDGTEYFYGLKRMENAEWILIFLVPAEYVATNTLKLVNFVMVFIVIFTVIVAGNSEYKAAAGKTGGRGRFSGGTGGEQIKEQFSCQYVS